MEKIRVGPRRFSKNLQWLLNEWGVSKGEFGQIVFSYRELLSHENGRKRICRLLNGEVEIRLHDIEAMASMLGVPPAVLIYGTAKQVKDSSQVRLNARRNDARRSKTGCGESV